MKRKRFGIKAAVAAGVITALCGAAMAETIWVRFSAGGAAVAVVAALPVVVCDLLSVAPLV